MPEDAHARYGSAVLATQISTTELIAIAAAAVAVLAALAAVALAVSLRRLRIA